ncbi:MAG TPA: ATP-binding protein [Planctomycetota bacterium]|nr:ATP-binding protein [Planctomycetota bacterium]
MPGQPDLAEIRQKQARDIAERLWLASQMKVLSPRRSFSIADAVDVAIFLTERVFRSAGVRLEKTLAHDTPQVDADMGQVEQALVSVLLNACEASGRGGRVTVTTGCPANRRTVTVVVADEGAGMPPEVLKRVFEPFFSTWGRLGIGLSAAKEMLTSSGGDLDMESTVGEGTEVTFELPAVTGNRRIN